MKKDSAVSFSFAFSTFQPSFVHKFSSSFILPKPRVMISITDGSVNEIALHRDKNIIKSWQRSRGLCSVCKFWLSGPVTSVLIYVKVLSRERNC